METLHPGGISEACDTQKENKLLISGKADTCKILKEPSLLLEEASNCWRKRVMGGAAEELSSLGAARKSCKAFQGCGINESSAF